MAFVSKEKKAKIAAELKKIMPKDWKYSLAVRHHSTIVCTIWSAPVDLVELAHVVERRDYRFKDENAPKPSHISVNIYSAQRAYGDGSYFAAIVQALNIDNYDRSDSQSDYFDVGHYVDLTLGRWNKPFEVKGA